MPTLAPRPALTPASASQLLDAGAIASGPKGKPLAVRAASPSREGTPVNDGRPRSLSPRAKPLPPRRDPSGVVQRRDQRSRTTALHPAESPTSLRRRGARRVGSGRSRCSHYRIHVLASAEHACASATEQRSGDVHAERAVSPRGSLSATRHSPSHSEQSRGPPRGRENDPIGSTHRRLLWSHNNCRGSGVGQRKQLPAPGHSLELVGAARVELKTGADDQVFDV